MTVAVGPVDDGARLQAEVLADLPAFWGARDLRALHHPVWFRQFGAHGFAARTGDGLLVGYLLGACAGPVAYVHLVATRRAWRGRGVGRRLHGGFAAHAAALGAVVVEAVTTPGNTGSVAFHRRLGFSAELVRDYAGPGEDRTLFRCRLDGGAPGREAVNRGPLLYRKR